MIQGDFRFSPLSFFLSFFLFFFFFWPRVLDTVGLETVSKRVINVSQPSSSKDKSRWTTLFGVLVETCGLCLIDVER
ncbi:hypothetical protein BDV11DRAFT_76694 [Aspergillus similis]